MLLIDFYFLSVFNSILIKYTDTQDKIFYNKKKTFNIKIYFKKLIVEVLMYLPVSDKVQLKLFIVLNVQLKINHILFDINKKHQNTQQQ